MIESRGAAAGRDQALALDAADPLAPFRDRFIHDQSAVYLDGNSLGCLPRATLPRLTEIVTEQWGQRMVRAWDDGWLDWPVQIGDRLGEAALGAAAGQVAVGDSTTVCFYKLASAALDARPGRDEIVTDVDNFPTDRYVLEGLAAARGCELVWLRADPHTGPTVDEVAGASRSPDRARHFLARLLPLRPHRPDGRDHCAGARRRRAGAMGSQPQRRLGPGCARPRRRRPRRRLHVQVPERRARGAGVHVHAPRAPGPPAPADLGVARTPGPVRNGARLLAATGVRGLLSGTPPILALGAVDEGVKLVAEAGIDRIRAKGIALTELAIASSDARLAELGVSVASPRDAVARGAHVALAHEDAKELCAALIERGVVPDFRRPDVIRFGLSPLTTRFVDVWDGVEALRSAAARGRLSRRPRPPAAPGAVLRLRVRRARQRMTRSPRR